MLSADAFKVIIIFSKIHLKRLYSFKDPVTQTKEFTRFSRCLNGIGDDDFSCARSVGSSS